MHISYSVSLFVLLIQVQVFSLKANIVKIVSFFQQHLSLLQHLGT